MGLAGRFPQAPDLAALRAKLRAGEPCLSRLDDAALLATSHEAALLSDPACVKVRGILDEPWAFDAAAFGYTPREARLLDPQQRHLLEVARLALDDAALGRASRRGRAGLYASLGDPKVRRALGAGLDPSELDGSLPDLGPGRVAAALDLRGPCVLVQAACASSLAALHVAAQALLSGEVDVAVVAAVSLAYPDHAADRWREGGVRSPDGRCVPFSALPSGVVGADAAVALVLTRGDDPRARPPRALLRATALLNDGAARPSFAAPGAEALAQAIADALAVCGLAPDALGLVEAHGAATPLGDAAEIAALGRALRGRRAPLPLGSVKASLGHADAAAGLCGLAKLVLELEDGAIYPSPHPDAPPHPGLAAAQLRRVSQSEPWDPARPHALLLSLGMGGSSAAALLSPAKEGGLGAACPQPKQPALLTLSAHTPSALAQAEAELSDHLQTNPHAQPDEVAATLREGRAWLPHRRAWVAQTAQEAAKRLDDGESAAGEAVPGSKRAWLCAGLEPWSCWPVAGLGRDPRFAASLDASLETLRRLLGQDLRPMVHASADRPEDPMRWAFGRVHAFRGSPTPAQHGLHAALLLAQAALWGHVGARPDLLLGYSLGECVAAALAGLWSHEDALWFIVERARLLDGLPPGAMISVLGGDEALALPEGFTVAAQLGAGHRVVAGPAQGAEAAQRALRALGLTHQRLQTQGHALHTPHALPCAEQIGRLAEQLRPSPLTHRWLSGADGADLDLTRAASADHWFEQATRPVRLDLGLSRLLGEPKLRAWITLGPGDALARVAAQEATRRALPSPTFAHAWEATEPKPWARWLGELGRLWVVGALPEDAAWPYDEPTTRRGALPPTPSARRRFFPEDATPLPNATPTPTPAAPTHQAAPSDDPAQPQRRGADTRAHLLAKLWAQSFGVERVGLEDHFFAMGGHSLLALQLLARVQRAFGVELPLRLLWEHPTPARMERAWTDWERSEARAQEARALDALRAAPDDEHPALLRAWLGLTLAALLKLPAPPSPHAPLPLAAHLPALLAALRPLTDAPLYPHELEACDTLEALAHLLESALAPTRAPTPSSREAKPSNPQAQMSHPSPACGGGTAPKPRASGAQSREGAPQPLPPAFILSSARSGSTLLRVLLAGHAGLFAPPELHLWGYGDLAQRAAGMLSPSLRGGLARAWGEARGLSPEAARAEIRAWEAEGLSVREADARLRAACAPRVLVDKSPDYAEDPEALRALREAHPDALLVHLVRHPRAVMESYVRRRMDALSRRDGALDPWSKAEAHWAACNGNILDLLDQRPGPSARVHYEDLVRRPEETLRRLCGALGVRYEPQMLRLEVGLRMRDGPGDPGFGERDGLDPKLADAWRSAGVPPLQSAQARALQRRLGYDEDEDDA